MINSKSINVGVTGSSGVLGKNLIYELKNFNLKIFKNDISIKKNVYNWVNENDLDAIIHFAAIVPTKDVFNNKKKSYDVNYMGTKHLVDALKKKYKKKEYGFSLHLHLMFILFQKKKLLKKKN